MRRVMTMAAVLALSMGCQGVHDGEAHPDGEAPHAEEAQSKTELADLGIKNMRTPADGLITGGQISEEQMVALVDRGYTTFINLRPTDEEGTGWEEEFAPQHGASFTRIPVRGAAGVTRDNAEQLAAVLDGAGSGTVVYCASGNRVGALLALKAHFLDGQDAETALRFGLDAGMTRLEPAVRELLALPAEAGGS